MRNTTIDRDRKLATSLPGILLFGAIFFAGITPLFAGDQAPTAPAVELKAEPTAKAAVPKAVSEAIPKTSVCKSELVRHVSKLASDEFKGRDPAGEGGMMAAKYLAAEFKKLGLKPNGDDGKYFQNFTGSRAKSVLWSSGKHNLPKKDASKDKKGTPTQLSAPQAVALTGGAHATEGTAVEGQAASSDEVSGKEHGTEGTTSGSKDGDESEGDEEGDSKAGGKEDASKSPMSDKEMNEAAKKVGGWLSRTFNGSPRKIVHQTFPCRNVLGVLPGSDPELKNEVIIISAHYDHLGVRCGQVYNGADDNASGTASMLELARVLASRKQRPRRTILFAAWDGEEKGLLGSSHWTQSPTFPIGQVVAVLNLDMIGRLRSDKLMVLGSGSSEQLSDIIHSRADRAKLKLLEWEMGGNSDHWPFYLVKIPSVTFCTGIHRDYHAPTDDIERVDFDGLERVARLALGLVSELGNREARVEFSGRR